MNDPDLLPSVEPEAPKPESGLGTMSSPPTTRPQGTNSLFTGGLIALAAALGYWMLITTAYTMINLLTNWIPPDLNSVIRAVCYGVGIISTFIQSRMWGQGTLPHHRKASFLAQLALQVFFNWAALFLIQGIS